MRWLYHNEGAIKVRLSQSPLPPPVNTILQTIKNHPPKKPLKIKQLENSKNIMVKMGYYA